MGFELYLKKNYRLRNFSAIEKMLLKLKYFFSENVILKIIIIIKWTLKLEPLVKNLTSEVIPETSSILHARIVQI